LSFIFNNYSIFGSSFSDEDGNNFEDSLDYSIILLESVSGMLGYC